MAYQVSNRLEQTGKLSVETVISLAESLRKIEPTTETLVKTHKELMAFAKRGLRERAAEREAFMAEVERDRQKGLLNPPTMLYGTFNGWTGDTTITLPNGEVWKQIDGIKSADIVQNPQVSITQGVGGGYEMFVQGSGQKVKVVRVK